MIGSAVTFNGVTINNRASQPLLHAQSPFYYVMLKNVDGLDSSDISYESHPLPYTTGEKSGDVFRRGKTVTLSGLIYGDGLRNLEAGADSLGQMFSGTAQHNLTWTRFDGVQIYLVCRVSQDLSIPRTVEEGISRWSWVVGLRADDPFTYKVSDNSKYPAWQA